MISVFIFIHASCHGFGNAASRRLTSCLVATEEVCELLLVFGCFDGGLLLFLLTLTLLAFSLFVALLLLFQFLGLSNCSFLLLFAFNLFLLHL